MLNSETSSQVGLYRNSIIEPDHRRHITVGRDDIFADTIDILTKSASKKPKHHFLFIGSRGIGKTHLLSLIEHEISSTKLSECYFVARFPEESNRTLSFADFLLGLCEILRDTIPDEPVWAETYEKISTEENDQIVIDVISPLIKQRRKRTGQALVVMVENLNQIFDQQIKDKCAISALRGFFMEDNGCLLIATAATHFGGVSDPAAPFFEFFDIQILDQLTSDETVELIRLNLEWENSPLLSKFDEIRPKIMAIYQMTGGSPRLALMLYELIAHESITAIKNQFELLVDRITPFYQDRMNDLSPQERAVLETIAIMRRETKTPAAIASRMRMKPAQASTLLGRLSKSRHLRSHENPKDKRSRIYTISEGFFDIWLAMNVSRGERARLPFLLDLFEMYYPTINERNRRRDAFRELAKSDKANEVELDDAIENLDYLSELGDATEKVRSKLHLAALYNGFGRSEIANTYVRELKNIPNDSLGIWISREPGESINLDYLNDIESMVDCWQASRDGELEVFAEKLKDFGEILTFRTWSKAKISFLEASLEHLPVSRGRVELRLQIGRLYAGVSNCQKAAELQKVALEDAEELDQKDLSGWAMGEMGKSMQALKWFEEAEKALRIALEINTTHFGKNHHHVAESMGNLAELLIETDHLDEAQSLTTNALEIFKATMGEGSIYVAFSLDQLAVIQLKLGNKQKAEELMRAALKIQREILELPKLAYSEKLNNLGTRVVLRGELKVGEILFHQAVKFGKSEFGDKHLLVANYLHNLANLYSDMKRGDEAESLLRQVVQIEEKLRKDDAPELAVAYCNLAILMKDESQSVEAEMLFKRSLEINISNFGISSQETAVCLGNIAAFLHLHKRIENASEFFLYAIKIFIIRLGIDHPSTQNQVKNYAAFLADLGTSKTKISELVESILKDEIDFDNTPFPDW